MAVDNNYLIPNSFGISSEALFVAPIFYKEDLIKVAKIAEDYKMPLIVLGSGTNILPKNYIEAAVAIYKSKGIKKIRENIFNVQAGEIWDEFVDFAVENAFSGVEALSGIPGTVGAAPVQNIGAYGKEIAENIFSVEVYDRKMKKFRILGKKECRFGYRNSVFKQNPGRFVIASVDIELSRSKPEIPPYKDVENFFLEKSIFSPTAAEIRGVILEIRKNKLPNYPEIPNAGSYFINPIIKNKKFYAGELIEKSGFERGSWVGKLRLWKNSALILTNPHKAGSEDILEAEKKIKEAVFGKFGIWLEREPVFI